MEHSQYPGAPARVQRIASCHRHRWRYAPRSHATDPTGFSARSFCRNRYGRQCPWLRRREAQMKLHAEREVHRNLHVNQRPQAPHPDARYGYSLWDRSGRGSFRTRWCYLPVGSCGTVSDIDFTDLLIGQNLIGIALHQYRALM